MNKHILIIPSWYVNSYNKLSGSFFREQAIALAKNKNLKIGLIAVQKIGIKPIINTRKISFKQNNYIDNNVITYIQEYPYIIRNGKLAEIIQLKFFKKIFKAYVAQHGLPDLVHLHSFYSGNIVLWLKKHFNIPYVVTEHSSAFFRNTLTPFQKNIAREVFEKSKLNLAVSEQFSKYLNEIYQVDFEYLPNIVNNIFINDNKQTSIKNDFLFINVAFLDKNKNQTLLIQAFYDAFKVNKNIKLWIIGDGSEFNNLNDLINQLNMTEQIFLLGRANRDEVRNLLSQAKVFVLSSKFETFGVAIIEALGMGLPVISTKCGGPESIITSKKLGILVENDDQKSLTEALREIYENYHLYDAKYISNFVAENFSESVITQQLIDYYDRALRK